MNNLCMIFVKLTLESSSLFAAYGQMDITVQEAIQSLITALVRSLGSSHGKLLTLMRTCPPGAESLALRVLTIFTEHGRPSPQLVALVKGLINERDLDARFLIPIIAEMDKVRQCLIVFEKNEYSSRPLYSLTLYDTYPASSQSSMGRQNQRTWFALCSARW